MHFPRLFRTGYHYLIKPVLFQINPETTHELMLSRGKQLAKRKRTRSLIKSCFRYEHPMLEQKLAGMQFANPVGLAAGFDKNGELVDLMGEVGFGFAHIGSITYGAYAGNPGPKVTRLKQSQGIIVNYGLKNEGAEIILPRLQPTTPLGPVGVSIAKTNCQRTAEVDAAIEDYCASLQLAETLQVGDFYTLNISCPNAFGGEQFTRPDLLKKLLTEVKQLNITKPLFLKMPLGVERATFEELCKVANQYQVTGLIIANLIKERTGIKEKNTQNYPGGVSGKPTEAAANELISKTYQIFGKRFILIGTGGVFSAADAYEKIKRGASLIQLITGMIFKGPQLIGEINNGLVELLKLDGYEHVSEAVGAYHR